jgi:hypothetical protein
MKQFNCLVFLIGIFVLSICAKPFEDKLTAQEIINKHLAAIGGKEAISKVKSRAAIGTVKRESQPEVQMVIMSEAPDRVSAAYIFQEATWRFAYDKGKVNFRPTFSGEGSIIEDKYREILASGYFFNGAALYNALLTPPTGDATLEAKGMKKVNSRQAYVVEYRRNKKSDVYRLFFDAETFMWVRTEYGRVTVPKQVKPFNNAIESRIDDQPTIDFYVEASDFKDVDGIKLPHKIIHTVTAPILRQKLSGTLTINVNEYRQNIQIDPKMFQ